MIEVEVVAKKDGKYYSKIMTLTEWKTLNRKPDTQYRAYEIGYYQNKNKITLK